MGFEAGIQTELVLGAGAIAVAQEVYIRVFLSVVEMAGDHLFSVKLIEWVGVRRRDQGP